LGRANECSGETRDPGHQFEILEKQSLFDESESGEVQERTEKLQCVYE